tara:strand:- start:4927 stop:6678 length:1752 start_codon:yes stop_codon:yes gene_type:complete
MKILKLLNKIQITLYVFLFLIVNFKVFSNEPVDIWSLNQSEQKKKEQKIKIENNLETDENSLIIKTINNEESKILEDGNLSTSEILLAGLYDPEEYGLNIEMWSNSEGEELKKILNDIEKLNLSFDSKEILEIALLTNSYTPNKNISAEEFFQFKTNYLIKNRDLNLIKKYLIKNKKMPNQSLLIKFFVDQHLIESDLENACSLFDKIEVDDEYLSKFKIYCLINQNKIEQAQLIYDLKKELGLKDDFFEKKFNILLGYEENNENEISDKNVLDFHISHRTNIDFSYSPDENTSNLIWKYLSNSNLLETVDQIDLLDEQKVKMIEKATHEGNYNETDLFDLYKRYQFNINQLLNVKETFKLLPSYEGRALLYQRLILTIDKNEIIDLAYKLKNSFNEDNIQDAFKEELSKILSKIEFDEVPSNYSTFYNNNIISNDNIVKKIKYNNKILHQSKILKYFSDESSIPKTEKDINDFLKKIKKDKKYVFTTKDIIILESLKSDGIKIENKFDNLYEENPDIPTDIQVKINNEEIGTILLRIVQIIGEDDLENLGSESLNFIVSVLNELNMDKIRNRIILKVLPLKV